MASFAPIRGTRAQVSDPNVTPIVDGQFLIETNYGNESKIYTDIIDNGTPTRIVVGGGGHEIIPIVNPNTGVTDMEAIKTLTDGTDRYVVNAYSIQRWSNCDVISLLTTAAKGVDTIGLWEDGDAWKNYDPTTDDPTVYRDGWLWAKDLFGILSEPDLKDNIEIIPVFDVANSEIISLYAMRIDDGVYLEASSPTNPAEEGLYELTGGAFVLTSDTTPQSGKTYYDGGGAVAFKFNNAVSTTGGVKVGLNLKYQQTNVKNFTVIS